MAGCLDRIARLDAGADPDDPSITAADGAWSALTYARASRIRAAMIEQAWAPATVNKHLSALRQVVVECWRLGLVDADIKDRVRDVENVTGHREPAGRAIAADELAALFAACDDGTVKGARDAAAVALMYATGGRRTEVVSLTLDDWSPAERALRVVGKGNKQRDLPVAATALPWLTGWLRRRGWAAGPILCPTFRGGAIRIRPLSGQALRDVLDARCAQAGVRPCTPHDFRRTLVGDLLDAGVDLVTVQEIAGHASPQTTSRYDRRPARRRLEAVDRLTMPQPKAAGDDVGPAGG